MKKWLLVLVSVIAAMILEIIQIKTQPPIITYSSTNEIEERAVNAFPDHIAEVNGYSITPNELTVEAPDPQLYLSTEGLGSISFVYFTFNRKLEEDIGIQIFYPSETGFSEDYSVSSICMEGEEFWAVSVPESEYDFIRIDMNGSRIPLKEIKIGTIPPIRNERIRGMHPVRIVIVASLLFIVLFWLNWCKTWTGMKKTIQSGIQSIRENKKKTIINILIFPVVTCISLLLFWAFFSVFSNEPMTTPKVVFACIVGLFSACLLVFRKTLKTQPEYIFIILLISIGFLYCYYVPHTGLNSWDEDVHYIQALNTSYVDSLVLTPQDQITAARNVPANYELNGGLEVLHAQQDALYHNEATEIKTFVNPTYIPEGFNGIGLFLGRALGLRYYMIHFLGRFTGLVTYAILGFLAIRKLKSGKMIAAVSLLVPTEVFLASSYNYDSYLTGFTALGICYYLALRQDQTAKVTLKDIMIMIGSIAFGCLTKPIYIPLLWILFLLPRNKFNSKKQHIRFVFAIIIMTCLVAVSYVIPSLMQGASISLTDWRGGSEVNAGEQFRFIIRNPMHYVRVMWDYLINTYFDLSRIGEMLTNYPYIGIMPNQYLYLIVMWIVAFTDKNEYDKELTHHPLTHLWPIVICLGVTILVMTSMYLAFTPVGANGILGAQFRYLIPMIIPVLLHVGSGMIENKMDRTWYNGLVFSVIAFVGFASVYNGYICKYYNI